MSLRRPDEQLSQDRPWPTTGVEVFEPSVPWRAFPWRARITTRARTGPARGGPWGSGLPAFGTWGKDVSR